MNASLCPWVGTGGRSSLLRPFRDPQTLSSPLNPLHRYLFSTLKLPQASDAKRENCVLKCMSADCFRAVYGAEGLEPGEVSRLKEGKFMNCLRQETRKKMNAKVRIIIMRGAFFFGFNDYMSAKKKRGWRRGM
jgi:hypothetical protein